MSRFRSFALVIPMTLAGTVASAEEPDTSGMSLEELKAIGLGQSRGDPIPVPADAPLENPVNPQGAKLGVIFLNFDGAQLSSGYDNSKTNTTQISNLAGSFAAYGNGSKRASTVQAVKDDWAPYNVNVVETRPGSGDYTMAMVGPTNPYGGGVLGIAPLDCNDSQTHNNIVYAFHSANDNFSSATQATTISQEVAHSYGLEHVNDTGDVMNPYNAGSNATFKDKCTGIDAGGNGIVCGSQHAAQCGSSSQQNGHKELMALFGAGTPDNSPPTVSITNPADGAVFQAGANFTIQVDASDDVGVQTVTLYSDGQQQSADNTPPYEWDVNGIPEGTYEFHAIAIDSSGNQAMSNVVDITVEPAGGSSGGDPDPTGGTSGGGTSGGDPTGGDPTGGGTSGGDPSGGDPSGGGSASGGDPSGGDPSGGGTSGGDDPWGGTDGDALPPGFGSDGYGRGTEGGCVCTHDPGGGGFLGLLLLPLAGIIRRRR